MLGDSLRYLPVVIPFALGTVVGGIDCTESAAAAGDEFDTNRVIAVEGVATLIAGCCGGVIQTTPYIGHPAYKRLDAHAGYIVGVAVVIAAAAFLGFLSFLAGLIPIAAAAPVLVFVSVLLKFTENPQKVAGIFFVQNN